MYYFEKINGKKILKSDLINNAYAFFTTRDSFLLSKDNIQPKIVEENKSAICNYLNIDKNNLITPEQTHSSNIDIAKIKKQNYPQTDGLILTEPKLAIFLNFADCTPLIFYDEKQNIGAVSHAGWRGTAQKISSLTVEKLVKEFDSKKENIKVLIGPTICTNCFDIGEEVFEKLKITVDNPKTLFLQQGDKIYADLKNINKRQLIEIGIKENNIDVCPYCTCCNNDLFFSYRKENETNNRHNAVLKLI